MAEDLDIPHVINEDTVAHIMKLNKGTSRETVIGGMRASGWRDDLKSAAPPKPPASRGPTDWSDVASRLDPNMPEEEYTKIQRHYFDSVIAPKVRHGYSVDATRDQWLKDNQRPKILSPLEQKLVQAGILATSATKAMIPGVDVSENEALLKGMAKRDGVSTSYLDTAGALVGMGLPLEGLLSITGPMSKALATQFIKSGKAVDVISKISRGGLAFAAYDALEAKDGDRVAAATRGALWGSIAEAGMGAVFGFSDKTANKVIQNAVNEKLPGPIEPVKLEMEPSTPAVRSRIVVPDWERPEAAVEDTGMGKIETERPVEPSAKPTTGGAVQPSATPAPKKLSLEEGKPGQERITVPDWERPGPAIGPLEIQPRPSVNPRTQMQSTVADALSATVQDARKKGYLTGPMVETPSMSGLRVITKDAEGLPTLHTVPRGEEAKYIGIVSEVLDNGGEIDGIHFHPSSRARASEFMRSFAEKAEAEDQPLRMKTVPGKAGDVARNLNKLGLRGTVVDDATVHVGPEAGWVQARRARQVTKEMTNRDAGKLPPAPPDDTSKTMMRIGEIRNRVRLSGEGRGETVPRAEHQELHHLAGDIGAKYGLTRTQVGQLALRYFENTAAGKGEPDSVIKMLDRFQGRGEPFGAAEGERPPVGFDRESRIRGYRKPTPSENLQWDAEGKQLASLPGRLSFRPTSMSLILKQSSETSGLAGAVVDTPQGPMRILSADADRGTVYHEGIHEGIAHAGMDNEAFVKMIDKSHRSTVAGIGQQLKKQWPDSYGEMPFHQLMNETFTHAAEAIRMNNEPYLEELGRWDTSVDHVKAFVGDTAGQLLEKSFSLDTAPTRVFQRRLNDLLRRTTPFRSDALARAQANGYTTWFNPETEQWVMRDGEGREFLKPTISDVWDHVEGSDPSSHFPDVAHKAYFKGLRGPIVPRGTEPVDGPATLEVEQPPLGYQALRSITQPTLDWAANVQGKLNKYNVPLKFYDAIKSVDEARKLANPVMDRLGTELKSILEGVPKARRLDYGEVLARDEREWPAMATALGLNTEDMANVRELSEWGKRNKADGGVDLQKTLQAIRKVRETGGNVQRALGGTKGAIAEAISNGQLGYSDLHVGNVAQWSIRQSIADKFMDEPLKALEELSRTKTGSGKLVLDQIQWPIRNYVNYMRGIPDQSQRILNSWIEGMTNFGERRIGELNKYLPDGLKIPEKFGTPKELMAKYQLLLYTAGLGARPAVFLRDTFQSMYALSVMGPSAFAEGMAKALTSAGRDEAEAAGALIHGRNVGEAFGDISGDLPQSGRISDYAVKVADKLLAPSRYGHNIGRQIAYLGEKSRAMREIARYRAGAITDPGELANRTGLWFQDEAPRSRLLAMAADPTVPIEEAAKQFGLAMNDGTQFALRSGTQGAVLRTGMGRIFGQYGTWPSNYIEFVRKMSSRAMDNPKKGVPAMGMWMAMNYGAFQAAHAMGIDAAKWLWFSPAGYAGSPNLELVQNIMAAPEESQAGLEARRKLHETPFEYLPTGVEMRAILRSIEDGEVNIPRILGFKPLDKQQDIDFDTWLAVETGFERPPRRP
jgi:hypothetical protein